MQAPPLLRCTALVIAGLAAALVSFGCSGSEAGGTPAGCEGFQQRFREVLSSAAGTCESDADCGCYSPVVPEAGCGGVTDAASAAELRAVEQRFLAAGCDWPHQCPPWSCEPSCVDGRCM